MDEVTPAPRVCEVCGRSLRSNNRSGICTINLECTREHAERARRGNGVRQRGHAKKQCQHPDECPNNAWSHGWCQMHWGRIQRTGEPGPAGKLRKPEPVINAGDVVGTWTVLEDPSRESTVFPVRCECGNERLVGARALLKWGDRPCVCGRKGKPLGRALNTPPGKQPYLTTGSAFGRLILLENVYYCHDRVRCICECGNEATPKANSLKFGVTKSCGCIQRERRITHGLSKHPLYYTWYSMVDRCTNPDAQYWESYGGRGIKVCGRWLGLPDGLRNFIADIDGSLGPRPDGWSFDRIRVEGNYELSNVRWASAQVQNLNKRTVATLTRERDAVRAALAGRDAEIAELRAELAMLRSPSPALF